MISVAGERLLPPTRRSPRFRPGIPAARDGLPHAFAPPDGRVTPATVCQGLPPSATVCHRLPPSATVCHRPATVCHRPATLEGGRSLPRELAISRGNRALGGGRPPLPPLPPSRSRFPHSNQTSARHCRLCAAVQIVSDPRDSKKGGRSPFVFGNSRRRQAHHLSVRRRSVVVSISCSAHDARSVSADVKDRTCTARPGTVADYSKHYERYSQAPPFSVRT
jgi:hypothetical protein